VCNCVWVCGKYLVLVDARCMYATLTSCKKIQKKITQNSCFLSYIDLLRLCACTHMRTLAHTHTHTHIHTHTHTRSLLRAHAFIPTRTHSYTHTRTNTRTHTRARTHTHSNTHICTHSNTHTHTQLEGAIAPKPLKTKVKKATLNPKWDQGVVQYCSVLQCVVVFYNVLQCGGAGVGSSGADFE